MSSAKPFFSMPRPIVRCSAHSGGNKQFGRSVIRDRYPSLPSGASAVRTTMTSRLQCRLSSSEVCRRPCWVKSPRSRNGWKADPTSTCLKWMHLRSKALAREVATILPSMTRYLLSACSAGELKPTAQYAAGLVSDGMVRCLMRVAVVSPRLPGRSSAGSPIVFLVKVSVVYNVIYASIVCLLW
jgi:hypothetical protein